MKTKKIQLKDLQIGHQIKTFDGNQICFREVVDKFDSIVEQENQFFLEFSNGSSLQCSNNHPIMVMLDNSVEQILPEQLTIEHVIITDTGICTLINKTRHQTNDTKYVDITVDQTHTFFAANNETSEMILTHNSQGGTRDGSTTTSLQIWHPEIMDIVVLKNNKGTDDNRVKNLDYCIQVSKLFLNRMLKNEKISLFSTSDAPDLMAVWGLPEFDEKYLAYEKNKKVKRKEVNGLELLTSIVTERLNTGRIYIMFIDNVNLTSQFIERINMTNLCFTGDTMVAVADGRNAVSIKDLAEQSQGKEKFQVFSAKKHTNIFGIDYWSTEAKDAVAFKTGTRNVIEIKLSNGESFKCTPEHELATIIPNVYVNAKDSIGSQLQTTSLAIYKEFVDIFVIDIIDNNEIQDVYDLTVEDNHNFYITAARDCSVNHAILVHNCVEIVQPTTPISSIDDEVGEISLCNLGGINVGVLKGPETFHLLEKPIFRLVKALNAVIDIQEYPVASAKKQLLRRNLGIGVSNFAYWMAKNGLKYNDPAALPIIDELFEHIQFYLIKASMLLAQERGPAKWFHKTKYAQGVMPFDNVNKAVNSLVQREHTLPWTWLRSQVMEHGMLNSVLSAQMPVESSSVPQNSTNGIEPPRGLITTKTNKSGAGLVMIMPDAEKLAHQYTLAWDITSNSCINQITAVIQKWIDQAISVNHYYNPMLYSDNLVPIDIIVKDIVEFYKLGGKNLYYANTLDAIESDADSGCESGACTL